MGYSGGSGGLQKGREHAYTHFCKVKWHYIKSSISICGLLLLLWVWQHRGRATNQKMACALRLSEIQGHSVISGASYWEKTGTVSLSLSYCSVPGVVYFRYKATINFCSTGSRPEEYWLILKHYWCIIKHDQRHENTFKCSYKITFCPNPLPCRAALYIVNQAVKLSLYRHKNEGDMGAWIWETDLLWKVNNFYFTIRHGSSGHKSQGHSRLVWTPAKIIGRCSTVLAFLL